MAPPSPGGGAAPSTRSTRARSPTPTETASATCGGSPPGSTTSRQLGVEAIWLSPFFTSPMADFGYDVADYCDVDPLFGTLEDFDALVAACQRRGIRIVIDWVPNHTSDRHPWFEASRSAPRRSAPRLVRVARPGARRRAAQRLGVGLPRLRAGLDARRAAPASTTCTPSCREQPDLNWDNPEVEAAMHDVLRFWLDRGVDGFRLDAIAKIAKDPLLRDQNGAPRRHDEDWESIHDRLRGIRRVIDAYDDRMLVGEVALQGPAPHGQLPALGRPAAPGAQLRLGRAAVAARRLPHLDRATSSRSPTRRPGRRGSWPTTTCRGPRAATTPAATGGRAPARSR